MATVVGVEGQLRAAVSLSHHHGRTTMHFRLVHVGLPAVSARRARLAGARPAVNAQRGAVLSALPRHTRVTQATMTGRGV